MKISKRTQVKIRRWLPQPHEILVGVITLLIGLYSMTGGQIGFQASPDTSPHWVVIPILPTYISWLIVWLGLDMTFCKLRITALIGKTLRTGVVFIVNRITGKEVNQ